MTKLTDSDKKRVSANQKQTNTKKTTHKKKQTNTKKTTHKKKSEAPQLKATYASIVHDETLNFLATVDPTDKDDLAVKDPQTTALEVINAVNKKLADNQPDNVKWPMLTDLMPSQIASCIARLHHVAMINMTHTEASSDLDILAIYHDPKTSKTDPNNGIYTTDLAELERLIRRYNYNISSRSVDETIKALKTMVPHKSRNNNPDLIPVNNGIFNYKTKVLLDFDPKYIFTSKSHVNYNPDATNVNLHNDQDNTDWDVVSWMDSLSDDPDVVHLLWQVLGAIIRPNVPWEKSAWLYSTRGNNGKGTLCELMRNLCGPGTYAKISLRDFSGNDFLLAPLVHSSAIIVDENDVGTYIDKAANLKAVETGDVITINRKFKDPIAYQFKGFMVQCLNEFPRVKDKSNSFYRRLIFIPMTKNFQGRERRYIKQDYLHRPDVLEYVLYHILHNTNYYSLDIPDACKATMDEYQAFNDPVRQFASELIPECQWDLLPFSFLYSLYRAWFSRNVPNGSAISRNSFTAELKEIYQGSDVDGFTYKDDNQIRTGSKMSKPEPLIKEYRLTNWFNNSVSGSDPDRRLIPQTQPRYRGLIRV